MGYSAQQILLTNKEPRIEIMKTSAMRKMTFIIAIILLFTLTAVMPIVYADEKYDPDKLVVKNTGDSGNTVIEDGTVYIKLNSPNTLEIDVIQGSDSFKATIFTISANGNAGYKYIIGTDKDNIEEQYATIEYKDKDLVITLHQDVSLSVRWQVNNIYYYYTLDDGVGTYTFPRFEEGNGNGNISNFWFGGLELKITENEDDDDPEPPVVDPEPPVVDPDPPVVDPVPVSDPIVPPKNTVVPNTNDDGKLVMFSVTAALSLAVCAVLVFRKRKVTKDTTD